VQTLVRKWAAEIARCREKHLFESASSKGCVCFTVAALKTRSASSTNHLHEDSDLAAKIAHCDEKHLFEQWLEQGTCFIQRDVHVLQWLQ
jgi:hypothetical protein